MEENSLRRVQDRLREALSVPYVQKAVMLAVAALAGFLSARGLLRRRRRFCRCSRRV